MDFLWPGLLLLLVLVPGLVAAYIWAQRRRPRPALRYSSLSLVHAALPGRSRVRRHLPFALFAAALAALAVGISRPVAVVVHLNSEGICEEARVALLSVGDRPVLAEHAMKTLVGQRPSSELIRDAAHVAAAEDIDPPSDIHASANYRRQLANVLTRRALERAFMRAAPH